MQTVSAWTMTYRTAAGMLCLLASACAPLVPPVTHSENELQVWLQSVAATRLIHWQGRASDESLIVVAGRNENSGKASALDTEAASLLVKWLGDGGLRAELRLYAGRDPARGYTCQPVPLQAVQVSLSVPHGVDERDPHALLATVRVDYGPETVAVTQLRLTSQQRALASQVIEAEAPPGSQVNPYSADESDLLLDDLVRILRCNLMQAKWRAGTPTVSWDADSPSDWYRSIGLRLRDELVRLDQVVGAPASSRTVSSLELRAEQVGDTGIVRIVARATSAMDKENEGPALWHQAYFHAPESPRQVVISPPVESIQASVVPEVPTRAARVTPPSRSNIAAVAPPRISTAHFVRPASNTACESGDPWRHGAIPVSHADTWHTGECFAIEVELSRAEELYLLHQSDTGRLTRVFPTDCINADQGSGPLRSVRIPRTVAGSHAIQLTPPGGQELFFAVALGPTDSGKLRIKLDALPDVCSNHSGNIREEYPASLIKQIEQNVLDGHSAMRVLSLRHEDQML